MFDLKAIGRLLLLPGVLRVFLVKVVSGFPSGELGPGVTGWQVGVKHPQPRVLADSACRNSPDPVAPRAGAQPGCPFRHLSAHSLEPRAPSRGGWELTVPLPAGVFMVMFSIISMDFFQLDAAQAGYLMSFSGVLQMVSKGGVRGPAELRVLGWVGLPAQEGLGEPRDLLWGEVVGWHPVGRTGFPRPDRKWGEGLAECQGAPAASGLH